MTTPALTLRGLGWPETVRPLYPGSVGCVHCGSVAGSCHVCAGGGRTSFETSLQAGGEAWDRHGCGCDACARVRPMREAIEASLKGPSRS